MTLFSIRPGIEDRPENNSILLDEAKLHGQLSALATSYVRLIKESVLINIDFGNTYSIRDFQVLMAVSEASGDITASQVFKSTSLDPATVTRSVKALMNNGHLTTLDNDQDSRSRFLHLTESGQILAQEYQQACQNVFLSEGFAAPSPSNQDFRALQQILQQLERRVKILRLKNFN